MCIYRLCTRASYTSFHTRALHTSLCTRTLHTSFPKGFCTRACTQELCTRALYTGFAHELRSIPIKGFQHLLTSLPTAYKIHTAVGLKQKSTVKIEINRRGAFSAETSGCASLEHFLQPANKHPPVCKNLAYRRVFICR